MIISRPIENDFQLLRLFNVERKRKEKRTILLHLWTLNHEMVWASDRRINRCMFYFQYLYFICYANRGSKDINFYEKNDFMDLNFLLSNNEHLSAPVQERYLCLEKRCISHWGMLPSLLRYNVKNDADNWEWVSSEFCFQSRRNASLAEWGWMNTWISSFAFDTATRQSNFSSQPWWIGREDQEPDSVTIFSRK